MTKQKKIAVLCNYELLPERVGGMDYFFWMFDRKCKEKNIQVDWFFPNKSNHGSYSTLIIQASDYKNVENYFLEYCKVYKKDYSHIFTHFVELCVPFFYQVKQIVNAKIIAVDHNPRPLLGYPLKKRLEKKVKGILFSRYIDVFVGVSEYSKSQLLSEFGLQIKRKTIVIFNGIDINKFSKKTVGKFKNNFVVASHLRKDKGIQDLILAVNEIEKQSLINFKIDIYGKGPYELVLREMINDFSLQSVFNFKGSVSNLNELYSNYDYLIHPSHGETFCYAVVESLLCSLPVITTHKAGNVLKIVKEGENGFLFNIGNYRQLATIIKSINESKKAVIFDIDLSIRNNLTVEKMVGNYMQLIS
jgi:glycosyltransferase involved in cell wall biosynthesis